MCLKALSASDAFEAGGVGIDFAGGWGGAIAFCSCSAREPASFDSPVKHIKDMKTVESQVQFAI